MNIKSRIRRWRTRQHGIVLVLVVVAMTSVLGMAGLAMDFGLAFLTKSRMQNALDAAALARAKVLKATGSTTQATTDARTAFNYYLGELNRGSLTPTVQFSSTLNPFNPGSTPSNFIRVRMPAGYTIPTYLTRVFPGVGDTLTLAGSAVAGPIRLEPNGEVCNLTPIMVAAIPGAGGVVDTDCTDGACYGYTIGQTLELKQTATAGPGNFNLLRLDGNGGSVLRTNLAGGYNGCATPGSTIATEPGVVSGPFGQGLDTRFGIYQGGGTSQAEYPPDVNTTTYPTYASYRSAVSGGSMSYPPPTGVPGRRMIRVVFSDVSAGGFNGATTVPVTGIGCFFLLSPTLGNGNGGNPIRIPAEFTLDCGLTSGTRSNTSLDNRGEFFKIVLYKDADSVES